MSKPAKKTIEMRSIVKSYLRKHMVSRRGPKPGNHRGGSVPKATEKKPDLSKAKGNKAEQESPPLKPADTGLDGSTAEWRQSFPRHGKLAAAAPNKIWLVASTPGPSYATRLSEADLDPDWGFETVQFGEVGGSSAPTAAAIPNDE